MLRLNSLANAQAKCGDLRSGSQLELLSCLLCTGFSWEKPVFYAAEKWVEEVL
ncbi:hypothetical protein [Paenibacillus physcomitrellae]|uniref:hypothetical protein n=1 Tax=Paenibacillus physcomitrellae TaxID=1619311 RepID=UPI0012FD5596|nr:hypothetical protein [Paenibacillus physcomitrellae]